MRFGYKYHDSAGRICTGECEAADRDAVYAQLRTQSIRPMQVWALENASSPPSSPAGSKRRYGKRALAVVAVLAAVIAGSIAWGISRRVPSVGTETPSASRAVSSRPRHQLATAAPVSFKAACSNFTHVAEAWLARYAQPGVKVQDGALPPEGLADDLLESLGDDIVASPTDDPIVVDVKRVVTGLKSEVAFMLHSGRSVEDVLGWLATRQQMEADFRETVQVRVGKGALSRAAANEQLRALGLREL